MIFLKTDKKNRVVYEHYFPNELSEEDKSGGYLIEEIPEATQKEGYVAILYYTEDRGFWHEYENIPETIEQKQLNRIADLEKSVMELSYQLQKLGA